MAVMGNFSVDGLKKLQKQMGKLKEEQKEAFMEGCAKELAARLLAKVIRRTPVGQYPAGSGKTGGTLQRGWTSGKNNSNAKAYADSLQVEHTGNIYRIEIVNPVEYASYVEFGHRQTPGRYVPAIGKRLKAGWVPGQFMLSISEDELREIAPAVLEARIKKFLGGCFS